MLAKHYQCEDLQGGLKLTSTFFGNGSAELNTDRNQHYQLQETRRQTIEKTKRRKLSTALTDFVVEVHRVSESFHLSSYNQRSPSGTSVFIGGDRHNEPVVLIVQKLCICPPEQRRGFLRQRVTWKILRAIQTV